MLYALIQLQLNVPINKNVLQCGEYKHMHFASGLLLVLVQLNISF
jgi:hypothetical protein